MNGNLTDALSSFSSALGWIPIALLPLFVIILFLITFVRGSWPSKDFDEDDVKGLPKTSMSEKTSENRHTKTTDHLKGQTHD